MREPKKQYADVQQAISKAEEITSRLASEALSDAKAEAQIAELVANVYDFAGRASASISKASRSPIKPACRAGCVWCCYQQIEATAAEVLFIADYLHRQLAPVDLAALKKQVADLDAATRGLGQAARFALGRPCALLVDGLCLVYPVRPLLCRGWNSLDPDKCQAAVLHPEAIDDVRVDAIQLHTHQHISRGLAWAIGTAGLTGADLDFTAALRIALEDLDPFERWLAGEDVFRAAEITD
jgi:Fe-S-cluster containining protein